MNTAEKGDKNNEEGNVDKEKEESNVDKENLEGNSVKENEEGKGDKDKNEDYENSAKVETNIDIASIIDAVQKLTIEGNDKKTITFLDFAGQSIYYAFHQIYFSHATFCILVVDMSKNPEDKCEAKHVSDNDFCCSRYESWTYKGNTISTNIYML